MGRLHALGLTRKSCECERELVKQDKWKGWNLHRLSHFWPTWAGLRESNMVAILQTTTVQEPDLVSEVFQEWDRVNSHSGKEIIARLGRPGTEGKWPLPCLLILAMVKNFHIGIILKESIWTSRGIGDSESERGELRECEALFAATGPGEVVPVVWAEGFGGRAFWWDWQWVSINSYALSKTELSCLRDDPVDHGLLAGPGGPSIASATGVSSRNDKYEGNRIPLGGGRPLSHLLSSELTRVQEPNTSKHSTHSTRIDRPKSISEERDRVRTLEREVRTLQDRLETDRIRFKEILSTAEQKAAGLENGLLAISEELCSRTDEVLSLKNQLRGLEVRNQSLNARPNRRRIKSVLNALLSEKLRVRLAENRVIK